MEEPRQPIIKDAYQHPKFMAMMVKALLFRVAGQATFSMEEISEYEKQYDGIRVNYKESPTLAESVVTITLHSATGGN